MRLPATYWQLFIECMPSKRCGLWPSIWMVLIVAALKQMQMLGKIITYLANKLSVCCFALKYEAVSKHRSSRICISKTNETFAIFTYGLIFLSETAKTKTAKTTLKQRLCMQD